MPWKRLRKILQRTLFFPSRANRDLDDEIRFHLDEEARLQSERGLSDEDAAAAARRRSGTRRSPNRTRARSGYRRGSSSSCRISGSDAAS
jgi:hypothetical protein